MDAVAVSMSNGMAFRGLKKRDYIAMPLCFGIFQGVMPMAGFYAGSLLAGLITGCSGIVICLILSLIGGNMIREGLQGERAQTGHRRLTLWVLLLQAVATSIDAFAVGVGLCAAQVEILPAAALITAVTAALVALGLLAGRRFADALGSKAELTGGLVLVIIGLKAL